MKLAYNIDLVTEINVLNVLNTCFIYFRKQIYAIYNVIYKFQNYNHVIRHRHNDIFSSLRVVPMGQWELI